MKGIVEVKGAAREPGGRAKIAVVSHDPTWIRLALASA